MADVRRFDPKQPRDPDGKWGDGIPGPGLPNLDMEGFDLISEAEGTFGTLQMGVDDVGDVRMAFHEGSESRAVDLGNDEVADLGDILERLAASRDDLPADADPSGVYDDDRFGYDNAHKVELFGNGVISVTFGAEDEDPYTLDLDPPSEDSDDVQSVLDAIDDVLNEVDVVRSAAVGELRKFNPGQPRDPGGEGGGRWVKAGGAAKDALDAVKSALDGPAALHDEATIRSAFAFHDEKTGLTASVHRIVKGDDSSTTVELLIRDRDGAIAGNIDRIVRPAGERTVVADRMVLVGEIRGQGFAARYNAKTEAVYREHGIERVEVYANIDVGGYSNARAGYDFADEGARAEFVTEALAKAERMGPDVLAEVRDLADDPEATPIDFAMVGYEGGAPGAETMWPGKEIMLDSHWRGVKEL